MIAALLSAQAQEAPLQTPDVEYSALAPLLVPIVGALLLLLFGSLVRTRPPKGTYAFIGVVTGLVSLATSWALWADLGDDSRGYLAVANAVVVDRFAIFLLVTIGVSIVLGALVADPYLRREGLDGPEYHVLMLLSAAGGMTMAMANDLIVLFLGLEILSIALYVLAGFHRGRAESREAAIKYFVLGSFSSALFLYGVALVYGATGSTQLPEVATFLADNVATSSGLLLAGMALLLVGLGFKVAAVPFHAWAPDVYQGAPTPIVGFMAAAAKAAGFAGLLRVFFSTFATLRLDWQPVVGVLAVLTLVVGSVLAVVQQDVKRMLAYSSVSHAGYVLIGLQAGNDDGIAGALFYLLAYTFMVMGSFAVVTVVGRRGDADHDLDAYRGLAARRPGLAFAFTVLLLAQAGIPFTSGFLAKFYVIAAAVAAESYVLAVIGMLAAVIAAFFYLRVTVLMYMAAPEGEGASDASGSGQARPRLTVPFGIGLALAVTLLFTVGVGVVPQPIVRFAERATFLF